MTATVAAPGATGATADALSPADMRHLVLVAMLDAQERALSDGEPGGAEAEVAVYREALDDDEKLAALFAGDDGEPVPSPAVVTESRRHDPGIYATKTDLIEAVAAMAEAVKERKPLPPSPKVTELIRDKRGLIAGWKVSEADSGAGETSP